MQRKPSRVPWIARAELQPGLARNARARQLHSKFRRKPDQFLRNGGVHFGSHRGIRKCFWELRFRNEKSRNNNRPGFFPSLVFVKGSL